MGIVVQPTIVGEVSLTGFIDQNQNSKSH